MIDSIQVKNFMGFRSFGPWTPAGLNLVIGRNDTGKTGLLKLLYASARSLVDIHNSDQPMALKPTLSKKLHDTFMPRKHGLGELVHKSAEDALEVTLGVNGLSRMDLHYGFTAHAKQSIGHCSEGAGSFPDNFNALFIPAKEVLTIYRSILRMREQFNSPEFDDTYLDLVRSLNYAPQRGRPAKGLDQVGTRLEELFEGKVVQTPEDSANPFLFKKGNAHYTMPLTAEGIKKIGILSTLVANRQLSRNTLLFMDEPETALHPDAQRQLAEMLYQISQVEGVQVYLASHSYFLINQLAIIARREQASIGCISLERGSASKPVSTNIPVCASIQDLKAGMPDNSIMAEALAMFDESMKLELGR